LVQKAIGIGKDKIIDYVYDTMRNKFMKYLRIPSSTITTINFIIELNIITIIELIIKKFGFSYLLKYIFLLSIL
jgi:hypothetical protein